MILSNGNHRKPLTIEVVTDPVEIARLREVEEAFEKNSNWLQAHWGDLIPECLGKHLAVTGQEAFLADTPEEAIERARAAHPEDKGLLVQFITAYRGPKIYGVRRLLAS